MKLLISGLKKLKKKCLNWLDKVRKFVEKHKIKKEDAEILAAEKELAEMFEKVAEEINPILAAKWIRRELIRVLNYNKKELREVEIDEKHMIDLLKLVESKKITDNVASKILEKLIEKPFDVKGYVKKEGLEAVSDVEELEKYQWSSYPFYIGKKNTALDRIISAHIILESFQNQSYKEFVDERSDYQQELHFLKHLTLE